MTTTSPGKGEAGAKEAGTFRVEGKKTYEVRTGMCCISCSTPERPATRWGEEGVGGEPRPTAGLYRLRLFRRDRCPPRPPWRRWRTTT